MNSLKPASLEAVELYRVNLSECSMAANALSIQRFSPELMNKLSTFLGNTDNAKLIEVAARVGNYCDETAHADMSKAVKKLLNNKGVKLPRGKRTNPALEELVNDLTPLLLFFGVPLASGESSRLVLCLRCIGDELGMRGDPRDTLRRKIKIQRELEQGAYSLIMQAASDAWRL